MEERELLLYEMPSIAEVVSIGWMQDVIAWFLYRKVKRKMTRYKRRVDRKQFVASLNVK